MYRDPRYGYVKSIWKAGDLSSFAEVFRIVPKAVVAKDMGVNFERLAMRIYEPQHFRFREIIEIALLIEVEPAAMIQLVIPDLEEYINNVKSGKIVKKKRQ